MRAAFCRKSLPVVVLGLAATALAAADWPQWRGPARDGRSGVAARAAFPEALTPAWKVAVGEGHASPVVVGDRVYVFAREGEEEVVQALELATGKRVWRHAAQAPYTMNSAATSHGKGPKATPVVAGGRVFAFGISGILTALDAASGRVLWRKEFAKEYGETAPLYGVAQSPVVDAGRVIVHVGGPGKGALTAFDTATGAVAWSWKGDGPAYASPVVATIAGVRQVVTLSESFLVGISADTGQLLWQLPFTTSWVQNAVTPIVTGDTVVYSGLDHPLRAIRVAKAASGFSTSPAWENGEVAAYMSTPVLEGGRLYGLSHKKRGQFFCLDAGTGKTLWLSEGRQGENAALVSAAGAILALTTDSELLVLPLKGSGFAPARRWRVAESATWAHPVVTGEGLLVKDKTQLSYLRF
jgi:outer membrane protein assembly factor BamB